MSEFSWRIENKYSRWYDALMDKARQRDHLEKPYEQHHVWPVALGGNKKGETLQLRFKEHFLAHWLLTRFTSGTAQQKMRFALDQMCRVNRWNKAKKIVSSWQYEIARKAKSQALSITNKGNKYGTGRKKGFKPTSETLVKLSDSGQKAWAEGRFANRRTSMRGNPGYRHTDETKETQSTKMKSWWDTVDPDWLAERGKKIGDKLRNRTHTEDARLNMSAGAKRRFELMSEEERQEFGNKRKGRSHSDETRVRMSEASKELWTLQEYREKVVETRKGKKPSEATRTKMRLAQQKRRKDAQEKRSEESCTRISEAQRKRRQRERNQHN